MKADKTPTVATKMDALDMIGGKKSVTERTSSNQGDNTPMSLQKSKSPRVGAGVSNQPHQHPHLQKGNKN